MSDIEQQLLGMIIHPSCNDNGNQVLGVGDIEKLLKLFSARDAEWVKVVEGIKLAPIDEPRIFTDGEQNMWHKCDSELSRLKAEALAKMTNPQPKE